MCHGHVASSSTVPPAALTCSVALTVSDGVDNEEGVTEGENDDYEVIRKAERMGQIMIVRSDNDCDVIGGKAWHTRRLATQTVNALRQEGPRLKHRPKNLRAL